MTWKRVWLGAVFGLAAVIFTFKILDVPPGIETDEGAIAHNAALIAKTGKDQNDRFLPVFILSADKVDWKQPVVVYTSAVFFKIFGTSLLTFKLVNAVVALAAMVVLGMILGLVFDSKLVVWGLVIFATTPIVVVAARIGTETIYPVVFAAVWLLGMAKFDRGLDKKWLVLAGLALGASFYCYKSMRLIIPPWSLLSVVFIWIRSRQISRVILFCLAVLPFLAVTPLLEQKYAGAIFDRREIYPESYRHYAYYWLSNLNPALLFVLGDQGQIFAVEKYGMFLLGTLPLFVIGIKRSLEERMFFKFVLAAFVFAPLLFGIAGSDGYGHRLTAVIPLFVVLVTLGIKNLKMPVLKICLGILFVLSSIDFLHYYFFKYPYLHTTRTAFSNNLNGAFYKLSKFSSHDYYVQDDLYEQHGEGNQFFEIAYFNKPLLKWRRGDGLPENAVLLTEVEQVEGMENTGADVWPLFILSYPRK